MSNDKELSLMSELSESPALGQRDLAAKTGVSLGMVNTLLQRLIKKGWVTMQKANTRNVNYLLTPEGSKEFARRSYHFVKNTVHLVVRYTRVIDRIFSKIKVQGYKAVHLKGQSELDFLFRQSAHKYELVLTVGPDVPPQTEGLFLFCLEDLDSLGLEALDSDRASGEVEVV